MDNQNNDIDYDYDILCGNCFHFNEMTDRIPYQKVGRSNEKDAYCTFCGLREKQHSDSESETDSDPESETDSDPQSESEDEDKILFYVRLHKRWDQETDQESDEDTEYMSDEDSE
jgi:hypothetical protein